MYISYVIYAVQRSNINTDDETYYVWEHIMLYMEWQ